MHSNESACRTSGRLGLEQVVCGDILIIQSEAISQGRPSCSRRRGGGDGQSESKVSRGVIGDLEV